MFFNMIVFGGLWTIVGMVVDKIAVIFNQTIRLMPTYQDAVNGFQMTQVVYGILPAIMFVVLVINYWTTENSMSSGEV